MTWGSFFLHTTRITLGLTLILLLWGAFTRLSDSGLGCPDWPGCYAAFSPWQAKEHIALLEAQAPYGPVTMFKAWVEMLHRYLAASVGICVLGLCLLALKIKRYRVWTLSLLLVVLVQVVFGALTVTEKLYPLIVSIHLLLGMIFWSTLSCLWLRQKYPTQSLPAPYKGLRIFVDVGIAVLFLQIALGAWVSTNYAVLACTEFPLCQGQWVPAMDFMQGFQLWHPVGKQAAGLDLSLQALIAIHWTHRLFAFFVATLLCVLGVKCLNIHRSLALLLLLLVGIQIGTGIANIWLYWPLWNALLHHAGSAGLLLLCFFMRCHVKNQGMEMAIPI